MRNSSRWGAARAAVWILLTVTVLAISAVSPASSASTAEYTPGQPDPNDDCGGLTASYLRFTGGPEVNKLNVEGLINDVLITDPLVQVHCGDFEQTLGEISFQDSAQKITAGFGCRAPIGNRVVCPVAPTILEIDLGDGNDYLVLSLPVLLRTDLIPNVYTHFATISAGAGNDTLRTVNDPWRPLNPGLTILADEVSCGPGDDTVVADQTDIVDPDCEHVTRV
jgi:hypothetical protein